MLLDLVGRREYELKAEINKINTGDSYDDLAGDHHTAADDAIKEVDQGNLLIRPSLHGIAHPMTCFVLTSTSPVKLYAGHGPATSIHSPFAKDLSPISAASSWNPDSSFRLTR